MGRNVLFDYSFAFSCFSPLISVHFFQHMQFKPSVKATLLHCYSRAVIENNHKDVLVCLRKNNTSYCQSAYNFSEKRT